MESTVIKVALDIARLGSQLVIPMFYGDTKRTIVFSLTEGGKPYKLNDCVVAFTGKKADGNYLNNPCEVDLINQVVVYRLDKDKYSKQTTTCTGTVECQLVVQEQINDEGTIKYERIASACFDILVLETVYNGEDILNSESTLAALDEMYVPLARRIAGLSLARDVSTDSLIDALKVAPAFLVEEPGLSTPGDKNRFYLLREKGKIAKLYYCGGLIEETNNYFWLSLTETENNNLLVTSSTEPTQATVGAVGQMYLCTTYDGKTRRYRLYYCSFVSGDTYNWVCFYDSEKSNVSGENGLSAYEIAQKNGFEGTVVEWLESLQGPQGEKGETGSQGLQGEQGLKGDKGDSGVYVGSGEMPEGYNVQIDISGGETDLSGFATKEYVDNLFATYDNNILAILGGDENVE